MGIRWSRRSTWRGTLRQVAELPWVINLAVLLALLAPAWACADLLETTDPQREVDLGREVARQVEMMLPVSRDKALQARVERVGQAIVEGLETRVYPYQFKVLAVPEYNAFSVPGGFIYVYEGLLDRVPDDNALAFVLAHEVCHVAHRHWAKRTEDMKGVSILGALAVEAIGGSSDLVVALASTLVYLRYSRSDESDADQSAMEYLWRSGFDPEGAVLAMQEIAEIEKGQSVPRYLRNHPPASDRLKRLEAKRDELKSRPRPASTSAPAGQEAVALTELVGRLPPVEVAENPWFPLAVGNRWTYSVRQSAGAKDSYSVEIVGRVQLESGTVYRAAASFGKSTVSYQLLTSGREVWKRGRPMDRESPWQLECVTEPPAESDAAGEESPTPGSAPEADEGAWEYRLVGAESVTLPCGAFPQARRIQKRRANPPTTIDMWFVEKVGMVKRTVAETGVTETLTHYQIAAPAKEMTGGGG